MKNLMQSLLKKRLNDRGLSLREAAKEIGVTHTTLARILQGMPADVDTIVALSRWLDVRASTLIDMEGDDNLINKIAVLIEYEPGLESVFTRTVQLVESGKAPPELLREIVAFAAYRLNLQQETRQNVAAMH